MRLGATGPVMMRLGATELADGAGGAVIGLGVLRS